LETKSPYTQTELLLLIAEGNEQAFNQFYLDVLPNVTPFLFRMLKSEEAMKEVLQEALTRFWLSRDKLPEIENGGGWFFRILSNECYRYLRKNGLRQRRTEQLDDGQLELHDKISRQTELDISFRETQRIIAQTVAGLSPRQQTVYRMSREQGLTLPEIAAELGLTRDYVKQTLMKALQVIRKKLTEAGRFSIFMIVILFFRK
jgi:RNA polymerase sigma factor (sigma-70 family)